MKPRIAAVFATVVVGVLALLPGVVRAQGKFGYVDMQRALSEIEEGKAAKAKLKAQFDVKQKELDQKQEELKRDNANLEGLAKEGVLKDDKLRDKKAELEKKLMDVTKYWQDSQKALSEEERKLTQEIFGKMSVIIRGIAEQDGLTFVFDKNEAGLVYAPDSMDLTNELVRKYNAKYGAGKQGSGKPAAGAKSGDSKPADSKAANPAPKK